MFGRLSSMLDEYPANEFCTSDDNTDSLGRGGFGTVRICWHEVLGKVAAKTIDLKGVADASTVRQLTTKKDSQVQNLNRHYREGATLARIDHPNIVKILGYTIWGNNFAYILEYVEGGNLDKYLKKHKQSIPWKLRLRFARQLISAINYLHNHSFAMVLVHGDIKPANALLTFDRQLKLADFGAVNVYRDTHMVNENSILSLTWEHTALYASPEFLLRDMVHLPGDIYSYAMVLYEIVTTQTVYHDQSTTSMRQIAMLGRRPSEQDVMNASPQPGTEDKCIYDLLVNSMHHCWNQEFQHRPSACTVFNELSMTKIGNYDDTFHWEEGPIDRRFKVPLNEFFEIDDLDISNQPNCNFMSTNYSTQYVQPNMPQLCHSTSFGPHGSLYNNQQNPQQVLMPGQMQTLVQNSQFMAPRFMTNGMSVAMYPQPSRSVPPQNLQQQSTFWPVWH